MDHEIIDDGAPMDDSDVPARREAHRILLLSDARGQYIPRDFAREVKRECVSGISADEWETLEAGPDHEWYWETWNDVERNAVITDSTTGIQYHIMQDGDCWLIEKGAEYDDATDEYYVEL